MVLPQARYEEIIKAIVIVVTHGNSHPPADIGEPGLVGNISKSAVAIIVIERAAGFATRLHQINGKRVNEEEIRISVVVVIKQRDTAAHRLDDVLLIRRGYVFESDPGARRDVGKYNPAPLNSRYPRRSDQQQNNETCKWPKCSGVQDDDLSGPYGAV